MARQSKCLRIAALDWTREQRALHAHSISTTDRYRRILLHFATWMEANRKLEPGTDILLDRVKRRHIERWLMRPGVNGQLAARTMRVDIAVVKRFFSAMYERGVIPSDPTKAIKPPKVPRPIPRGLTKQQVAAVLSACPDQRSRLAVTLMVQMGLRVGEVAAMQVGDLDLINGVAVIRGKGDRERVLPIPAAVVEAVNGYWTSRPTEGPLLRSATRPAQGIQSGHLIHIVGRTMRDAGIPGSAHSLRHTCATDLVRAGVHLRDVQRVLGHASLMNTQIYMPYAVGDLREALEGRDYTH